MLLKRKLRRRLKKRSTLRRLRKRKLSRKLKKRSPLRRLRLKRKRKLRRKFKMRSTLRRLRLETTKLKLMPSMASSMITYLTSRKKESLMIKRRSMV